MNFGPLTKPHFFIFLINIYIFNIFKIYDFKKRFEV